MLPDETVAAGSGGSATQLQGNMAHLLGRKDMMRRSDMEDIILDLCSGERTYDDIADRTGYSKAYVSNVCRRLAMEGRVDFRKKAGDLGGAPLKMPIRTNDARKREIAEVAAALPKPVAKVVMDLGMRVPQVKADGRYDEVQLLMFLKECDGRGIGDAVIAILLKVDLHRIIFFRSIEGREVLRGRAA
jgi:DNA-binding CsgD family transcriptional regulator